LDLLEQCFVVFVMRSFSRNLRKEISKSFKVYFYDLGVRNSLIQAYGPLALRDDVGALWENFLVLERLKLIQYQSLYRNRYFWRTHDQKEIDYLEEHDGILEGYEFKWGGSIGTPASGLHRVPREFLEAYPGSSVVRIDRSNFDKFLMMRNED
jgi:predicted AAA+ superfamily ATPase